jgi:hypothetical protein
MIQNFLDWVQEFPNVWLVSNQQMMQWLQNPVKNSEISKVEALGCREPDVPKDAKLCNGIPQNEVRLGGRYMSLSFWSGQLMLAFSNQTYRLDC